MSLLTVREVAEKLRISQVTVRRHIASGKLRAVRVGRGIRVEQSALRSFVLPVRFIANTAEPDAPSVPGDADANEAGVITFDDPIWGIVGIVDDDGPTDAAVNHDKYLAEAYGDLRTDDDFEEAGVLTFEDSLWNIVGIGESAEQTDIRWHKDEYIADAIAAHSREP